VLKAGRIQGEASIVSGVLTKFEPHSLGTFDTLTIVENGLEMRKLWPLKVK
jgi:hypothetical protein